MEVDAFVWDSMAEADGECGGDIMERVDDGVRLVSSA